VRHISVEVALAEDDATRVRGVGAKAPIITTATFEEFNLRGIYGGEPYEYAAKKDGSPKKWTLTPDTWPGGSYNTGDTPFYAFNGGNFNYTDVDCYVNFTVAEDAFSQHDLLVATNTVKYSDNAGKVSLTFDHACAAVNFKVYMSDALYTKLDGKTLTVTSISLENVYNKGKYSFFSGWKDQQYGMVDDVPTAPTYTLTNTTSLSISKVATTLPCENIFMIPQTRPADGTTGVYLKVMYKIDDGAEKEADIPFAVTWLAGKQYTINISLGTKYIVI
jgi:hypothetical protein